MSNFGEFLKQQRTKKNLTQKSLAKLLYVSESAVSKWEKNIAHPDITLLPRLSEILGVSEHELITASIDISARNDKKLAKRWRAFAFSWSLFFYISYGVALIPCFICNLAIDKKLSWFWIVLSALILSFTFTNLPRIIKKHRLIFLPLAMYLSLCLLLGICCIYTGGNWFWVSSVATLLGAMCVFLPIYISRYKVFSKLRGVNDFISVGFCFVVLNIMLVLINLYTLQNTGWWYLQIALPISVTVYGILNILLCVRFLRTNRFIKTSVVLFLIAIFAYLPPLFVKVENPYLQKEIDDLNIFKANLSKWVVNETVDSNVNLILALTVVSLAAVFLIVGLIRRKK